MAQIGDLSNGGIVFYVDTTGEHGLVASTSDLSTAQWGCLEQVIGDTQEGIVDYPETAIGLNNSNYINSRCGDSSIAAKLCLNYTYDGYNNWFLPSKDELNLMYENIRERMLANYYWSSSEYNKRFAWQQHFATGNQYKIYKHVVAHVKPIRAF